MNPLLDLVSIAKSQLGTQEDAAHTNRGEAIRKYQESTSLGGQGWPWCAAFVCWCVWQFLKAHQMFHIQRPVTAAAFGLIDWARANNCLVFTPSDHNYAPQPGDIVVFNFSHCGILSRVPSWKLGHDFDSFEGNSNDDGSADGYEVVDHDRTIEKVRAFIRLPAPGVPV